MSYVIDFTDLALSGIEKHKKSGDKAVLRKLEQLLNELIEHPKTGTGHPEMLKHELQGLFSRKITKKHRLIYMIKEEVLTVLL